MKNSTLLYLGWVAVYIFTQIMSVIWQWICTLIIFKKFRVEESLFKNLVRIFQGAIIMNSSLMIPETCIY